MANTNKMCSSSKRTMLTAELRLSLALCSEKGKRGGETPKTIFAELWNARTDQTHMHTLTTFTNSIEILPKNINKWARVPGPCVHRNFICPSATQYAATTPSNCLSNWWHQISFNYSGTSACVYMTAVYNDNTSTKPYRRIPTMFPTEIHRNGCVTRKPAIT